MPKKEKKKGSTSTMAKVIIGILAVAMMVPALATFLQLLF